GATEGFRCWRVLEEEDEEEMENPEQEMLLSQAREKIGDDGINPGDTIEEPLETIHFNLRVSMLSAKQYLFSRLREAERRQLLNDLLERDEDLISGQIIRILREKGDAVVEVMHVDCRLPKREMIPRESLKVGDRVQALIKETISETRGQQIILTRTSPQFLVRLFQRVVPEIEKGILEIIAAVRSPGNRAKIAVRSSDTRVDPVGTCVGIRGSRVQVVTNELNGERIDIIQWDEDPVKYVLNALAPAEVSKIEIDSERQRMDVLVEPDLMAQAIGKNGTNVRLASELTGWQLNLCTPIEYQEEKEGIATKKSEALAQTLNLDTELARVLFDEGFETLEHVAFAQTNDLIEIEGITEEIVAAIQQRAKEAVEEKDKELQEKLQLVDIHLIEMEGITEELLYDLVAESILTLDDLADLSSEELLEIVEIPAHTANELIMRARNLLEEDEEPEATETEGATS
nr:transcription termination factor NusA [Pseudomonadota bacterium]